MKKLLIAILVTFVIATLFALIYLIDMAQRQSLRETQRHSIYEATHQDWEAYYINEGYNANIAEHMVKVELGILPKDFLYNAIKED